MNEIDELLPLVDEEGNVIGTCKRSLCHKDKSLLHPVIHLHVFNAKNELYLQKRPQHKLVQPDKWDTAVGGHVSAGETIEQALQREAEEEIKLKNFKAEFITKYIWESDIERELVFVYKVTTSNAIGYNPEEVDEARFWSLDEVKNSIDKMIFTPNFEYEFLHFNELFKGSESL
jgi:isopentenyldiphosphate isomerase